jgi:hypothetical protein
MTPPHEEDSSTLSGGHSTSPRNSLQADGNAPQYLYIVRHGDRWDYENPTVRKDRFIKACLVWRRTKQKPDIEIRVSID